MQNLMEGVALLTAIRQPRRFARSTPITPAYQNR